MAKAQYQKEATSAKGPALHLTGSQINSNHSVRVTSKQKGAEASMGMPSAAGAAIVDLDLHGQRSDLEGSHMMPRPGMRTAEGMRPGVGGSGSRRGNSHGAKQWTQFPVKVQNMNSLVQIKKKRPKMKYNDRLAFQAEKERQ